jgi:hypothetical protein
MKDLEITRWTDEEGELAGRPWPVLALLDYAVTKRNRSFGRAPVAQQPDFWRQGDADRRHAGISCATSQET